MSYYVFRLPKVIEDIIKIYTLGFGTRVCRIFRNVFKDLINNSNCSYPNLATCWRLFVTLHGRVKCHSYSSVAFHDLQIARLQGPINVPHNMKQQLIEHQNEFLQLHFKSSYYLYWNPTR